MNAEDALKMVRQALDDLTGQAEEVTSNTTLTELGLDSLGRVELAMALEEKCAVPITDDQMTRWKFVSDVVRTLIGEESACQ